MAMSRSAESPLQPRDGGDGWTIVHHRVSELIENGGMSDISLPPLPPFGASETGSQDDGSGGEEDVQCNKTEQRPHDTENDWPGSAKRETSDGNSGEGEGESSYEQNVRRSARRRNNPSGNGSSRRRTRGRGSGGGARGAEDVSDRDSSRSISPAARPRRRAARTERSGRRLDERPPPLQSSSESSSASFSSPSSSLSPGGAARRGLLGSSLLRMGRNSAHVTAAEGNGLIPFSLEDVTTIDPSETLSATSSPFRTDAVDHRWRQNPVGGVAVRHENTSTSASVVATTLPANTVDAGGIANGSSGGDGVDGSSAIESRDNRGQASREGSGTGASLVNLGNSNAMMNSLLSSSNANIDGMSGNGVDGRGRFYSTAESQLSNSNLSTNYSSSVAVSAAGLAAGLAGSQGINSRFSSGGEEGLQGRGAGQYSGREIVQTTSAGRAASAAAAGTLTTLRQSTTRDMMTESGAWSLSSAAGGTGALGRMFGGAGGGEWGLGSTGAGRTGSVLGLSSFKVAVLEARADAAEEQGEFWQGRAMVAEKEKRRLEKVVAEQSAQLADLMERVSGTPHTADVGPEGSETLSSNDSRYLAEASTYNSEGAMAVFDGNDNSTDVEGGVNAADMVTEPSRELPFPGAAASDEARDVVNGVQEGGEAGTDTEGALDESRELLDRIGGISFTSFSVGQVAMFFPTPEGNFLAFNVGCPAHFLSKESQALVGRDDHFRPYYILGRIIEIQEVTCSGSNPYKLPNGQPIKVVSVETISPELRAAGLKLESRDV